MSQEEKSWDVASFKYFSIEAETPRAILVSLNNGLRSEWFPAKLIYHVGAKRMEAPEWIVKEKKIPYRLKPKYHKPKKVNPVKNQEAMDELIFSPEDSL